MYLLPMRIETANVRRVRRERFFVFSLSDHASLQLGEDLLCCYFCRARALGWGAFLDGDESLASHKNVPCPLFGLRWYRYGRRERGGVV